jgi:ABC-2 type transport system ATP-binding protein
MTGTRKRGGRLLAALVLVTATVAPVGGPLEAAEHFEERRVRIPVSFPDDSGRPIELDATLTVPTTGTGPYPAIVLNHGFGGSRTSDSGTARRLVAAGYIVLRWSQRGFGETGGEVDLMGQKERQDLLEAIDWLNDPANVPEIRVDHIGQVGASYGGHHAMALATMNHPAVKAIAPIAASLDFYRALAPNDVPKLTIIGSTWATAAPYHSMSEEFHRIVVALTTGVDMAYAREQLQLRSEVHRVANIRTPLYLASGWNDSFFQAEEWMDLVGHLTARSVPVWMYMGGVGHPAADPDTGSPEALHIILDRIIPFFDHFVKGEDNGFRSRPTVEVANAHWTGSRWDGTTMYADGLPFGVPQRWHLCTGIPAGTLQQGACSGPALPLPLHNTFATTHPGGEAVARYFLEGGGVDLPEGRTPTPADTATFVSAPLTEPLQLTGTPRFGIDVVGGSAGLPDDGPGPLQAFQLDPLIWDVAPDGTRVLVTRGAYSEDLDAPLGPHTATFDAFGMSHRFETGHRIQVELSTSDMPFLRPASNPFTVVVSGGWLDLPGAERLSEPVPAGSRQP